MSLLNASHFLGTAEAPIDLNLNDFQDESIFEHLLQGTKTFEKRDKMHKHNLNFDSNIHTTDKPILDDLFLPSCSSHDFLMPEESHGFHEDPLLFSVEQNELQPITSPFMVPGIYKKIPTVPTLATTTNISAAKSSEEDGGNVFLSMQEPHGRILKVEHFHEIYVCDNDNTSDTAQPRRVNLVKHNQDDVEAEDEEQHSMEDDLNNKDTEQLCLLTKLAYNILKLAQRDHLVIDKQRNEIVRTENGTNQKTIYRLMAAETMYLKPNKTLNKSIEIRPPSAFAMTAKPIKLKLGRPRKRPIKESAICDDSHTNTKTIPKPKAVESNNTSKHIEQSATNQPQLRTRSGRLVKVLKPTLIPKASEDMEVDSHDNPPEASADIMRNFLAEIRDSDFGSGKPISPSKPSPTKVEGNSTQPSNIDSAVRFGRRVPPEAICPTCKKIFLGKRLQRHFIKNPDHMLVAQSLSIPAANINPDDLNSIYTNSTTTPNEEMTLFRFLIWKLQKSNLNEDQRVDLFINEINDLVEQLQLRSSRLIRNTSGLHLVTARAARVLGIPEGQYALDMTAIEAPPDLDNNYDQKNANVITVPSVNTRSLDYTTLSLDDTLTDEAAQKLNLSAGGKLLPPSEESLLRAVDDLVHDKLGTTSLLNPPVRSANGISTLVPHYDHASDNAVEAVSMKETTAVQQTPALLDLAVDFFQFNNN